MLVAAPAALAQDATWRTTPGSGDFNTPTNWTPASVPNGGFATFGGSSVTTLTFSGSGSRKIDGFIFNSNAPVYTFNLTSGFGIAFHTDGIINNSANAPIFNVSNSHLSFEDSSTAGNAIINLNAGTVQFLGSGNAGVAQLNAAVGTTFDFTGTTGPLVNNVITAGSIAGAGNFSLGANQLFVGANNLSTTVSGTISGNALAKVGTGTLTFSGANSYSGGTTVSDGILVAAHKTAGIIDALGSGPVTLDGGALRVNVTGDLQNSITFNDAKTSTLSAASGKNVTLTNASTVTLGLKTVAQFGSLTDTGTVTFGAATTIDPTAAVIVAGGTLKDLNNSLVGLTFSAASTTVIAGATLDFSNSSNQAIHNLMGAGTVDTGNANNLHLSLIVDPLAPASEFSGTIMGKGDVSIVGGGTMILSGVNTYKGGTFICDCSTLQLGTSSSTGSIINGVANDGIFNIVNANTLGITKITNDGSANSSPGDAFGTTNFRNATTASSIDIVNKNTGATNFFETSSAASASILNNGGTTGFFDLSGAGTATITNKNGGTTIFGSTGGNDMAGAVSANITNQQTGGATIFQALTTAGFATIDNNGGITSFFDTSNAGSANITNRNGGLTLFDDATSAAGATIVNRQGNGITPGLIFAGSSDAGSANITNKTFGFTAFSENSSAAGATILNQNNGATVFGTVGDAPTAGNANITNDNGGTTQFAALSTAGNATILTRNGGATGFFDNSNGGDARFITRAGGIVDFSQTTGLAGDGKITAGSIAGGGDYYLGGNQLTVGSNDRSTRVSGTINDGVSPLACGCVIPGSGASLVKIGTGTLTLSGTNTYTGGTTITAGTLQLGDGGATGSILGDVVNNATLAFNRSNANIYQFDGAISGSGAVQQNGPGTTTLTAVNTFAGPTTISAGTLALSGTGSIANSSGVTANGTFDISGTTAGASIKTLSGAGIVTLGSRTLTLTNASGTFGGAIGGNGGLVKQGAGLFTLSGTNTYLGATTVAGGEFRVNGSVASAVDVQSGATLSGTGSVGGLVTVQSGGTLSAGQSPGTLTLGALNLNSGSTSIFELGSPGVVGGATNDLVNVTGNLTLGGTLSVNAPSAGYYRLFNYGTLTASSFGSINGSSNAMVLTNVPNQVNLSIAAAGQQIQFWDGADQAGNGVVNGGTGTWNATNTNWTGAPGQANINDQWRSSVGVFAGTAGTVTVAGAQAFDTLQFSTTGYVLNAGAGGQLQLAGLSGTGTINTDNGVVATINAPIVNGSSQSLTKVGGGTLILAGTNTYSGGTTISGGTLQLGNGGTTGSIVGNVTDNGIFAIKRSDAFTFGGTISGSGAFQQLGSGTTTLTGVNTYTGTTTISSGTLAIAAGGSITSNVTNNATFNNSGTVAGTVVSFGTFTNNVGGVVTGRFTSLGIAATNSGSLNGGVSITDGTLTTTGTILGGLDNIATVNANGGAVNGAITNRNFGGIFNVNGTVTSDGTFDNSRTAHLNVNSGTYTVAGLVTNSGALVVANGATLVATSGISNGGDFLNAIFVAAGGTIRGNISNSAAVTNNGLLDGRLTNTGGTATNAGTIGGGATVTGGTLTTTGAISGGLVNSATVNANGGSVNGAIANNAGGTFNVGGTLTSDNAFTNAASATLAIGASGAYTLQGLLTNSGAVTVANGGQLIATVGGITNNAGGSITVALGGTIKDDLNNAGVVTNNGAYVANVATNTGSIANGGVWTGNVVSNAGTIDNNLTWTGTVSNAGTFNNNAGATVSGLLTNTAGTTVNNGALNGGANVSGGVFTGSGTVTNLNVFGGTFAPGNGTPGSSMTISGNLAFQSGAMYLVALNPTTASFANVGGTASLNGTAAAVYLAGSYVAKKYTILTTAGGVSGTFGSIVNTNVPANFASTLSYDANNAYIDLTLNFNTGGLNINQQNVANTLVNFFNSTGGIPAAFGSLSPNGLTQASGELATASQQTTFDAMNLFLGLLTDPFVAGRGNGVAPPTGASQFAEENDAANAYAASGKPRTRSEREAYAAIYRKASIRETYDPRWSVWAAGYGGSQTTDGNAALGSNTATSRIFGTAVGADYLFSPRTLAGFALAGGGTNFSVNGLGTGRSDLFQAGAFVRHTNGPAYISAALAYGWQDVTTDRTVAAAGGGQLRANFNANAFSGRVEGGYRFVTPWMAMGLTPYAAGQFTSFDLPAYVEQAITGANNFALGYAAKSVTASRSEFGVRSDKSFAMQDGIFTLRGRAAWAHNFSPDRTIAATFQTLPGASFVVNGAAQASDAALVTGSAEMKWLNGFSMAATFEGEFSNVTRSYAGKGVVRYAW
jgi:fibronectin-binding autotransporter adhesin